MSYSRKPRSVNHPAHGRLVPIVAAVLFFMVPTAGHSQGFSYTTNADVTLNITGYSPPPVGALTIPTNINGLTVTSVGASAFANETSLSSVTIANSITSIGDSAFDHCFNLDSVLIPTSVATIGNYVFYHCINLTSVEIPSSVTNLGFGAFSSCFSLSSVTIANGVATIGTASFENCTSLTSVVIPASVTDIEDGAFQLCFNLSSVVILGNVTNIGQYAFGECSNLTAAYFNKNAPVADSTAFSGTGATAYYLPGTMGWDVFSVDSGVPAVPWNPQAVTSSPTFGVQTNQFGFTIIGTSNITVVVEACADLSNPVWTPVSTNTLINGSSYFSDPAWSNFPARFYGFGFP